jgi:hypothetical protein
MNRKLLLTFLLVSAGCLYAADRDEFVGFDLSRFLKYNNGVTEIGEPENLEENLNSLRAFLNQGGEIPSGEISSFQAIGTLTKEGTQERVVRDNVLEIIRNKGEAED